MRMSFFFVLLLSSLQLSSSVVSSCYKRINYETKQDYSYNLANSLTVS